MAWHETHEALCILFLSSVRERLTAIVVVVLNTILVCCFESISGASFAHLLSLLYLSISASTTFTCKW
jgi:hypothetical protein